MNVFLCPLLAFLTHSKACGINVSNSNDHDDIMSMFDYKSRGKWARKKNMLMSYACLNYPSSLGDNCFTRAPIWYGWTCMCVKARRQLQVLFLWNIHLVLGVSHWPVTEPAGYTYWPTTPGDRWDLTTFPSPQRYNNNHEPSHPTFSCQFWRLNWGPHTGIESSVMTVLSPQPVRSTDFWHPQIIEHSRSWVSTRRLNYHYNYWVFSPCCILISSAPRSSWTL